MLSITKIKLNLQQVVKASSAKKQKESDVVETPHLTHTHTQACTHARTRFKKKQHRLTHIDGGK
jgi:hypothetical protein